MCIKNLTYLYIPFFPPLKNMDLAVKLMATYYITSVMQELLLLITVEQNKLIFKLITF
jgi:hypothetical protein